MHDRYGVGGTDGHFELDARHWMLDTGRVDNDRKFGVDDLNFGSQKTCAAGSLLPLEINQLKALS